MLKTISNLLLAFLLTITSVHGQQGKVDSLLIALKNTSHDTVKIQLLIAISSQYRKVNHDSMFYFGKTAHDLSKTAKYLLGEAEANLTMGISKWRQGEMDQGRLFCEKALLLAQENNFKETEANCLNNIGLIFNYEGNYSTALEYYQKAIIIAESTKSKSIIASILNNVGGIYYNLKNYDQALHYWLKTLNIQMDIKDQLAVASTLNNLALVYAEQKDFEIALKYFNQSLSIYSPEKLCSKIYPLENIGSIYLRTGQLDSAVYYLNLAVEGAEVCKDFLVEMGSLSGLGEVYQGKKEYSKAIDYYKKAYLIGNERGFIREKSLVAQSLSSVYEQTGQINSAFEYFKIFHASQDSLYNDNSTKELGRLEAKYDFEKKQREREIGQKLQKLENEKQLVKQKWIKDTFIVGFIIMLFIAFLFYRNFKLKQNDNKKLEILNKEINRQKAELMEQAETLKLFNESLNENNDTLEQKIANRTSELEEKNKQLENNNIKLAEYAFINAHKLRAPVATILGLIELFNNEKIETAEKSEIINKIKKSSTDLDEVVKQISIILEEEDLKG